jgi:hypothetical protein
MRTAAGNLGSLRTQPVPIDYDRECDGCSYNLRGLRIGSRCPECGLPIVAVAARADDPLDRMPMRVIRVFRRAAWLATLCIFLTAASIWSILFRWSWPAMATLAIVLLTGLWIASMWALTPIVATPEARSRGFSERGIARRIARWGQFSWLVLLFGLLAERWLSAAPAGAGATRRGMLNLLSAVEVGALVGGCIAMIAMAVLMERLAEWARDDAAERLFRLFQWLLPLALLLAIVTSATPKVGLAFHALALIGALLFPLAMIMLTGSITLSAVHHREHLSRERRRAERRREENRVLDERLRKVDG